MHPQNTATSPETTDFAVAGATQNAEIKYKTFIIFDELLSWHS
jgi:hypothetical protein